MNKVICDICGTAYPETASQCPICGNARQIDYASAPNPVAAPTARSRVKGGRFSKANVRKRNRTNQTVAKQSRTAAAPEAPKEKSNKGLLVTAVILLIAVIAVVMYILMRFVFPVDLPWGNAGTTTGPEGVQTTTADTGAATTDGVPAGVACTALDLDTNQIILDGVGRAWLLEVTVQPENTTDQLVFTSGDEKVATVTEQGRITAIGEGSTVITVRCGDIEKSVFVSVKAPEQNQPSVTSQPPQHTTAPSTDETTQPEEENGVLTLDTDDITFSAKDETHRFDTGELSPAQITWSSDDENIATVENGKVTAVAPGTTTIRAKYGDQETECIIRCNFEAEGEGNTAEYAEPLEITDTDVTLSIDESFTLRLKDYYGDTVPVSWVSSDTSVCTVSGNTVTGVGSGSATVSATVNGETFSCTVRVG